MTDRFLTEKVAMYLEELEEREIISHDLRKNLCHAKSRTRIMNLLTTHFNMTQKVQDHIKIGIFDTQFDPMKEETCLNGKEIVLLKMLFEGGGVVRKRDVLNTKVLDSTTKVNSCVEMMQDPDFRFLLEWKINNKDVLYVLDFEWYKEVCNERK